MATSTELDRLGFERGHEMSEDEVERFQARTEANRDGQELAEQVERLLNGGGPDKIDGFKEALLRFHPTLLGLLWNAVAETVEAVAPDGRLEGITSKEAHLVRQPLV